MWARLFKSIPFMASAKDKLCGFTVAGVNNEATAAASAVLLPARA